MKVRQEAIITVDERDLMLSRMHRERKAWGEERAELLKAIETLQGERLPTTPSLSASRAVEQLEPTQRIEAKLSVANPESKAPNVVVLPAVEEASSITSEDFFGMDLAGQANLIGLKLLPKPLSPTFPTVLFHDFPIRWPWIVANSAIAGLSPTTARLIDGKVLNEVEMLVLFAIREASAVTQTEKRPYNPGGLTGFEATASLESLADLKLVTRIASNSFEISSAGRLFLAWLLRLGFRFASTHTTASH